MPARDHKREKGLIFSNFSGDFVRGAADLVTPKNSCGLDISIVPNQNGRQNFFFSKKIKKKSQKKPLLSRVLSKMQENEAPPIRLQRKDICFPAS